MADVAKRCVKCGVDKSRTEFHRSATSRDGRSSRCKTCRNQDSREYLIRRQAAEAAAEERGRILGESRADADQPRADARGAALPGVSTGKRRQIHCRRRDKAMRPWTAPRAGCVEAAQQELDGTRGPEPYSEQR